MKLNKFVAGLAMAVSAISLSSCSEDFEIAAPYKDVTIVYGILNVDDAAQYIRIQKSFMDENRSAIDLSKLPDSSYYRSLEVHVKALNGSTLVTDDVLTKVDMATENLPKQPGVFFQTPSYAYKYTRAMNAGYRYRLVIKNLETGNVDSAETNLINTNPLNATGNFFIPNFSIPSYALSFPNVRADNTFSLTTNVPTNTGYLEGFIRFKYASKDANTNIQTDSSFDWKFATQSNVTTNSVRLSVDRSAFYSVINANIKPAPVNIVRYLDSADVYVWAANQDFNTYMIANSVQGGITADQIKTNYTNIKGKAAVGLLASRAMRIRYNIPFDLVTLDSIKRNNLTKGLNFAGFADH